MRYVLVNEAADVEVAEADSMEGMECMLRTLWEDGERGTFALTEVADDGAEAHFAMVVLRDERLPIDVTAVGGE